MSAKRCVCAQAGISQRQVRKQRSSQQQRSGYGKNGARLEPGPTWALPAEHRHARVLPASLTEPPPEGTVRVAVSWKTAHAPTHAYVRRPRSETNVGEEAPFWDLLHSQGGRVPLAEGRRELEGGRAQRTETPPETSVPLAAGGGASQEGPLLGIQSLRPAPAQVSARPWARRGPSEAPPHGGRTQRLVPCPPSHSLPTR